MISLRNSALMMAFWREKIRHDHKVSLRWKNADLTWRQTWENILEFSFIPRMAAYFQVGKDVRVESLNQDLTQDQISQFEQHLRDFKGTYELYLNSSFRATMDQYGRLGHFVMVIDSANHRLKVVLVPREINLSEQQKRKTRQEISGSLNTLLFRDYPYQSERQINILRQNRLADELPTEQLITQKVLPAVF